MEPLIGFTRDRMKMHKVSYKSFGVFLVFATLLMFPVTLSPAYANHSFGSILNLSNSDGTNSITPQVVASGSDVHVLWQEGSDIFFADSTDTGANFGVPINLSMSGTATAPQISGVGSNVYAVWQDGTDISFIRSTDNGVSFPGPVIDLNAPSAFVLPPQIASLGNNVYAIWTDFDGVNVDIYFINSTDNGATFPFSPIKLSVGAVDAQEAQIVVSGNNVYVVWRQSDDVFFIRSNDAGASFSAPVNLSNSGGGPNKSEVPQLAADGSNVYVIWEEGIDILFVKSTDSGATFSAPLDIGDGASSANPQIAAVGSNVYTVWEDNTGSGDISFRASTDGGTTFNPPVANAALNLSNNSGESTSPVIVASGTEVYVVWADDTPTNFEIHSRVSHDNGNTFDNSIRLTNNAGVSITPQFAADSGNIFVAWDDDTPDAGSDGDILFSVGAPAAITVAFDQPTEYRIGDTATITVTDAASNTDNLVIESIIANVVSTTDGGGITLTLTETGPATGIFSNTVEFLATSSVDEISIQVEAGDIVTASFGGETADATVFPITIEYKFNGLVVATPSFDYGDIVNILVTDQNANLDPGLVETITVTVTSLTDPVGITLDLVETGPNTGMFGDVSSQLIFSENNQPFPTSGTITVTHENNPANADPLVIDTTTVDVKSTSDPVGITLTVTETDVNSSIFSGTLTLTTGPSVPDSSIQVVGGDILTLTAGTDDSNSLIDPNPDPSLGAIQVDFQNPDTVTVSYQGQNAPSTVSDTGGGGGGGGGVIRPGLVLDVVAGISLFGGGGSSGPKAPTVSSSSLSFGPEPGFTQLQEGAEFEGIINQESLDDSSETQIIQVNKDIEFSFDLFENGGKGNLEHVALYLNMRGEKFTYADSDAYIIYEKNKPLQIVDPNGLFANADFEILEKDNFNLILKYNIKFAKSMEKSHILLRVWDFNKWSNDVVHENAIEVVNGEKSIPSLEGSAIVNDSDLTKKDIVGNEKDSLDKVREKLHTTDSVPAWLKTSAGWWSEKKVTDSDFILGVEYLIENDVIQVSSPKNSQSTTQNIPDWISTSAGWWSKEMVSDEEFISSLQWLIDNGVMKV